MCGTSRSLLQAWRWWRTRVCISVMLYLFSSTVQCLQSNVFIVFFCQRVVFIYGPHQSMPFFDVVCLSSTLCSFFCNGLYISVNISPINWLFDVYSPSFSLSCVAKVFIFTIISTGKYTLWSCPSVYRWLCLPGVFIFHSWLVITVLDSSSHGPLCFVIGYDQYIHYLYK